jgi:hypothetical protein
MHASPSAAIPFPASLLGESFFALSLARRLLAGVHTQGLVRVLPVAAGTWPGSRRWYGQPLCWSRRGPRMALELSLRLRSMRYDADRRRGGLVFRKRTLRRGALVPDESLLRTTASAAAAATAADALDRAAGMIKKAAYRSSGRRVRGEDDKITAIKTAAPDLPLDVLRNMNIRVDPWSALPCAARTPCGFSRRAHTLAHQL